MIEYVNKHPAHVRVLIAECYEHTKQVFENIPPMSFCWDSKMRTSVGWAKCSALAIGLNARLLIDEPVELKDTIYHEIAHIVNHYLYQGKDHDAQWQDVMGRLGRKPSRCHAIDVSKIKRRWKRYAVRCNICEKQWQMTSVKARKVMRGALKCRPCNKILEVV